MRWSVFVNNIVEAKVWRAVRWREVPEHTLGLKDLHFTKQQLYCRIHFEIMILKSLSLFVLCYRPLIVFPRSFYRFLNDIDITIMAPAYNTAQQCKRNPWKSEIMQFSFLKCKWDRKFEKKKNEINTDSNTYSTLYLTVFMEYLNSKLHYITNYTTLLLTGR